MYDLLSSSKSCTNLKQHSSPFHQICCRQIRIITNTLSQSISYNRNMDVPKRILVDFPKEPTTNGNNHAPAGYYDSDSDDDYEDDYCPPKKHIEPTAHMMSPPKTLTATDLGEEERRRFMRDTSLSGGNIAYLADDSMYKTPNDTVLKSMTSFSSGDPVSVARQVRHLHNRVKLLEEELQTQHNRQVFLIGVVSIYIISRSIKWFVR